MLNRFSRRPTRPGLFPPYVMTLGLVCPFCCGLGVLERRQNVNSNLLTEEQVAVDKRSEPRRNCSVYVTFGSGFRVATARIMDYSDSGLRIRTSANSYLGKTIEIIDSESPLFSERCGNVVWQRTLRNGAREFGVSLAAKPDPFEAYSESRFDRMWNTILKVAFEEVYA